MQVSSARLYDTFHLFQTYSARAQVFESFAIMSRANSNVALSLIVADSFCLASRLTGDKAD